MLQSQLLSLPSPSKQSLAAMSKSFHDRSYDILTRASSSLYPHPSSQARTEDKDYVSLGRHLEPDPLSYLLKTHCTWLFESSDPPPPSRLSVQPLTHIVSPHLRSYSHVAVDVTVYFISTLLAATLLFVPIYSLFHVSKSRPGTAMGLIAMFTILFAGIIALVTNAERGEIFGATAAYAAVLVVFVSGDFASNAT